MPSIDYASAGTYLSENSHGTYGTLITDVCVGATSVNVGYKFTTCDANVSALFTAGTNSISTPGSDWVCVTKAVSQSYTAGAMTWNIEFAGTNSVTNSDSFNLALGAAHGDSTAYQLLQYAITSGTASILSTVLNGHRELTPEEQEAEYERRRAIALEDERRAIEKRAANIKAIQLLWGHLNAPQKRSLRKSGWFDVLSKCGRKYRLLYTMHGNVLRMSNCGEVEQAFCGHMGHDIPLADTLLSQKLLLTHNPDRYEKQANKVQYEHTSWCRPQKTYKEDIVDAISTWSKKQWLQPLLAG